MHPTIVYSAAPVLLVPSGRRRCSSQHRRCPTSTLSCLRSWANRCVTLDESASTLSAFPLACHQLHATPQATPVVCVQHVNNAGGSAQAGLIERYKRFEFGVHYVPLMDMESVVLLLLGSKGITVGLL